MESFAACFACDHVDRGEAGVPEHRETKSLKPIKNLTLRCFFTTKSNKLLPKIAFCVQDFFMFPSLVFLGVVGGVAPGVFFPSDGPFAGDF